MVVFGPAKVSLHVLFEVVSVNDDGLGRLRRNCSRGLLVRIGLVFLLHDEQQRLGIGRPGVLRNGVVLDMSELASFSAPAIDKPDLGSLGFPGARRHEGQVFAIGTPARRRLGFGIKRELNVLAPVPADHPNMTETFVGFAIDCRNRVGDPFAVRRTLRITYFLQAREIV